MAIDYSQILTTFVKIAQDAVGTQLSSVGPTGSPEPAVIVSRQAGPTPDYPYVQIDLISTAQTDGWLIGEYVDSATDEVVYETHYKLLLQYSVYGGNAVDIAHRLESVFRHNSILDRIENETTGTLEETFLVRMLPVKNAGEWLEVAQFQLTFNINDRSETNIGDGIFQTINIDGEVKRNEDDPDPLLFSVSESSI